MKFLKKLHKRWQSYRFTQHYPEISERRNLLKDAIRQGKEKPNAQIKWRKAT